MVDIKEYVENCLKKEKLIIKCKLTTAISKRDYVINIINIDEIVKWRKRNGITQKEMGISNILGLSFRHYQSLEEKEILPIMAIKTIKSNSLIGLEFVEEDAQKKSNTKGRNFTTLEEIDYAKKMFLLFKSGYVL